MRRFIPLLSLLVVSFSALACSGMPDVVFGIPLASSTPTVEPFTPYPEAVVFTETPFTPAPEAVVFTETPTPVAPDSTATPAPSVATPPEAIAILSPGVGSQVSGPITVSGIADSVFENMLSIKVLDQNGEVIGSGVASIHADLGSRGPFDGQVSFTPPAQAQPGRILVSDSNARDGNLTHLSSVEVTLLPNGSIATLTTNTEQPEAIQIQSTTDSVSSGHRALSILGYAAPTFEQTLTVNVLDESGGVAGSGIATIQAEAGQPGTFIGSLTYTVDHEQPGSVQVYVTSARDGGITHLSSVAVTLQP
jgi:Immunoglobulin-like domain of bacterial spore germination